LTTLPTNLDHGPSAIDQAVVALPADGAIVAGVACRPAKRAGTIASLIETTKPGITKLVTTTSMVGFVMSAVARSWRWPELVATGLVCLIGTAMSAAGANAVNQWMERDRDAVMPRTQRRPLPQHRVTPGAVLGTGVALCVVGVATLLLAGPLPALISLACIVSYVAFYTPMKTRTTVATFIGAIPGALPPLIGWTAASQLPGFESLRQPGGLSLFALMFAWQIPHFMAIAWMYRDDYAKGGYMVLPVVDPSGRWTSLTIALWTAALIPATLLPARIMPERLGTFYLIVAGVTGAGFALLAARLVVSRGRSQAKALFFGSITHLPVLLLAMVAEALVRTIAG
jgi:protoheme IX farnesyltransferase